MHVEPTRWWHEIYGPKTVCHQFQPRLMEGQGNLGEWVLVSCLALLQFGFWVFLALPIGKRLCFSVGFDHKVLARTQPNVWVIWRTMCAYDGWACSIKVYAPKWEVLDPIREVFCLMFEPVIKGSHYVMSCLFLFLLLCVSVVCTNSANVCGNEGCRHKQGCSLCVREQLHNSGAGKGIQHEKGIQNYLLFAACSRHPSAGFGFTKTSNKLAVPDLLPKGVIKVLVEPVAACVGIMHHVSWLMSHQSSEMIMATSKGGRKTKNPESLVSSQNRHIQEVPECIRGE